MKFIKFIMLLTFPLTSCCSIKHRAPESVAISSSPPGAHLVIDGYDCGTTPCSVALDPKFAHEVAFSMEGYPPQTHVIQTKRSLSRLSSNGLLPIGLTAAGATAGLIAVGGVTGGLGDAIIILGAAAGLVVGVMAGTIGTGVDLYTGKGNTLRTHQLHVEMMP